MFDIAALVAMHVQKHGVFRQWRVASTKCVTFTKCDKTATKCAGWMTTLQKMLQNPQTSYKAQHPRTKFTSNTINKTI